MRTSARKQHQYAYMIYENGSNWIVSGTSAAAPAFAAIMALVVEKTGGTGQGSANPQLYSLANAEPNPFHPTLSGNNSVPGVSGFWATGAAYNLAKGLGSVDAAVLAASWDCWIEPAVWSLPWTYARTAFTVRLACSRTDAASTTRAQALW
jgi:subtilase family serine protease